MQNILLFTNKNFYLSRQAVRSFYYNRQHHVNDMIIKHKTESKIQLATNHVAKNFREKYISLHSLLTKQRGMFKFHQFCLLSSRRNFSTGSSRFNNAGKKPGRNKENNKNDDNKNKAIMFKALAYFSMAYLMLTFFLAGYSTYRIDRNAPIFVSWNDFVSEMLAKGEVHSLLIIPERELMKINLHPGAVYRGKPAARTDFYMIVKDTVQFEEQLRQAENALGIRYDNRVPIDYYRSGYLGAILVYLTLAAIIVIVFRNLSVKYMKTIESSPLFKVRRAKYTLIDPATGGTKGVRFSDVAGLSEAKIEIMEFVDYLKYPSKYKSLGAKVPQGALLLGPPGCGKTLLAKAVASEANVPFLSMNGSEFIEVIGGVGALRMRELFNDAKKFAPSIIYIDEIDAIGKARDSSMYSASTSESDQTLNQLLVEMDGMQSRRDVIVLASTNRSEVLDKALLRPGRFDRHILIDLPTLEERRQIFELHLKSIVLDREPSKYAFHLANLTPGFSGADIAVVCNEAALHAAREKKKLIDSHDLFYAIDRKIGGPEKKHNAMSPTEKKIVAYHEAGHALIGWLLEHTDALLKVSIVPRTNLSLGFSQYTPLDFKLFSKEQLFDRMCMALGGRAAESIIFNSVTHGAKNDLEKVTDMAYAQVQRFGMNETVGLLSFHPKSTDVSTKKPYSKYLANIMDIEARKLVARAYQRTEEVLKNNIDKLDKLAKELLKRETLNHKDVTNLIGPPPFGNKKFVDSEELQHEIKTNSPPPSTENTT